MTDNHADLLESYKAIASVLKKNGITFYGMYGTTLGAIRHNGFIPWDDDLDLGINVKDLDRTNEVLSKELDPERFYYHNPSADTHPHVIIKTENFEKELKDRCAPFIDIFVLIGHPDSLVRRCLIYPFEGFELLSNKIIDNTCSRFVKELFYRIMYVSRKIIRFYSKPNTKKVCARGVKVSMNAWSRDIFSKTKDHVFEDTTIPLPVDSERFLTEYYGDYMTPPPEGKRSGATGYPYGLIDDYTEDMNGTKKHRRLCSEDLPM